MREKKDLLICTKFKELMNFQAPIKFVYFMFSNILNTSLEGGCEKELFNITKITKKKKTRKTS